MDKDELKIVPNIPKIKKIASISSFSKSNKSELEKILSQRLEHRQKILSFSTWMGWFSFVIIAFPILSQTFARMISNNEDFSIFDGNQLEILATVIFAQIFGIILIITKSLWDDSNYINKIANEKNSKKGEKPLSIDEN